MEKCRYEFLDNGKFSFSFSGLSTDVTHFLKCGANEIILKPLNLERFVQVMKVLKEDMNDDIHTVMPYRGIGLFHDDVDREGGEGGNREVREHIYGGHAL